MTSEREDDIDERPRVNEPRLSLVPHKQSEGVEGVVMGRKWNDTNVGAAE